ncbi:Smr/MutS family protein [Jannaschia aquimarina]|uniref:MutS2 protein n=1 Tax=Jannaschia aquimarina TaxID=935700 RepID=A0A0D1CJQ5_9RHOB|nr:Smr/MutS family protein [Jannaschia aquimarina]KIT14957.1 Endonuclease MutS2 [Jannaschia aquimarina]SNS60405.1 DNA-nicking endonuclease, Smr domain [Jannaschia aquimarina]
MTRRLTEADRRAWDAYRKTADPLSDRPRRADPAPAPAKAAQPTMSREPLPTFRVGERVPTRGLTADLAPGPGEASRREPVAMDRKAFTRLRAGKLRPEGKLDLHGMTLEVAHAELTDFILTASARGKRLLLVVTGKGKARDEGGPIPTRIGVLRHQVPQWLRLPPLAPHVLQVTEAHRSHGGSGAYYVYLRRLR